MHVTRDILHHCTTNLHNHASQLIIHSGSPPPTLPGETFLCVLVMKIEESPSTQLYLTICHATLPPVPQQPCLYWTNTSSIHQLHESKLIVSMFLSSCFCMHAVVASNSHSLDSISMFLIRQSYNSTIMKKILLE